MMVDFYYYNRFGKKLLAASTPEDNFKNMKELLLEDSQTGNIGDIFYIDESGEERCLDYYND